MRSARSALGGLLVAATLAACGGNGGPDAVVSVRIDVTPHVGPDLKPDGKGSLWLPASDTFAGTEVPYDEAEHFLVRIDVAGERISARVPVPHPMFAVAVGLDAVWATGTDFGPGDEEPRGSLVRIDPATNTVTGATEFVARASPADVAVGFGAVWVVDSTADAVYKIDPDTMEIADRIAVDGSPSSIATTDSRVWVTKPQTGEVRAIDPETSAPLPAVGVGAVPEIIESGGAGLWVARYTPPVLSRIDEAGRSLAESVEFPSAPSRFAVGDDAIVAVETEAETLAVVRGGRRTAVLDGRRMVAVAVIGTDAWAVALNGGGGQVIKVALPPP